MKVKNIIISQPEPSAGSPYTDIINRFNVNIRFFPFFRVEPVDIRDFRAQHISISEHTAIVFSAKSAIDSFFKMCEVTRFTVPETMKYFCTTESIANYLQKYIVYRKRKIFPCKGNTASIIEAIGTKHKDEKFLLTVTDAAKPELVRMFTKAKLNFHVGVFCRTVNSDLSSIDPNIFQMMVFYSPSDIKSLFEQKPDFVQNDILIATFGPATAKAAKAAGLKIEIEAPTPEYPSIAQALLSYLDK
ncbi:MAG: uroporphyrinogen-III synthase [Alistipes sp.]|nr:uroporphyrinogen-III synthase [Candidatus Minthomonas equi]